jgi:diadenosine tetraphosphate (Ap4A) HIT family hydrolase
MLNLLTYSYAFLDIQPLSRGHALVIPKEHAVFLHELSDDSLADLLPVAKTVAKAIGVRDYNILQNNGISFRDRLLRRPYRSSSGGSCPHSRMLFA